MTGKLMAHPELEDLAAYIEGKLSPAERAAITAHLAECDECFQVFSEAVRIGQEEEDEAAAVPVPGGDPAPRPFERRRKAASWTPIRLRQPARWLPAAIAAVLVLGVGIIVYRSLYAPPDVSNPDVLTELRQRPWRADQMAHGPTMRGTAKNPGTLDARSFQLGVLKLDLELVQPHDQETAAEICRQISNILEQDGFLDKETKDFRQAAASLRSGKAQPGLKPRLVQVLEENKSSFSTAFLDFGRWAEAGRLSAIAALDDFFDSRDNRRFLDVLRQDDLTKLEDQDQRDEKNQLVLPLEVKAELEQIAALWNDRAARPKLSEHFRNIIEFYFRVPPEEEPTGPD